MKKSLQHLVFGSWFAAVLVAGGLANAQTTTTTETPKPKRDWYPFHGTVAAVNPSAKTVSLAKKEGERVLNTDSQSTFTMDGKPVTLSSIKVGYYLSGTLHKEANKEEFILKAKIALEAPAKKGTNTVTSAAAPVVAATAGAADTSTNAVVKAKKKKKKKTTDSTDTNAPAANQ